MSNGDIVTLDILITSLLKHYNISFDESKNIAELLLDIFGFENRILDNILSTKIRKLFYLLQEESILTTQHERGTITDGKLWDLYYWVINKEIIFQYANGKKTKKIFSLIPHKESKKFSFYDKLSNSIWYSRKTYLNNV